MTISSSEERTQFQLKVGAGEWKNVGFGKIVQDIPVPSDRPYQIAAKPDGYKRKVIPFNAHQKYYTFQFTLADKNGPGGPPEEIPPEPLPPVDQRWAVVIGVSDYASSEDIRGLSFADADARSFRDFLVSPEGLSFPERHVRLLTNQAATSDAVRDALYEFLKSATKEDLVVIFFSGHGAVDPKRPELMYFLTFDADPASLASTAIPMHHVRDALDTTVKAERVVVLADACHSGGVASEDKDVGLAHRNKVVNRRLAGLAQVGPEFSQAGRGRVVFTSSRDAETSKEGPKYTLARDSAAGHGVFTWALLEGLWGRADADADKKVTLSEVIEYTDKRVRRATDSAQNPTVFGDPDELDLTLGRVLD